MSDSDTVSEYPSDLEFVDDTIDPYTHYPLDSGIESNDGYLTDIIDEDTRRERRERKATRNKRYFRKLLGRFH